VHINSLQQDYTLSAITYQLERLFELKSGPSLYESVGLQFNSLDSNQLQTLFNTHTDRHLQETCGLFLLVQHFTPSGYQGLLPLTRQNIRPLLQRFIPTLLRELEELLRTSGIHHDFLGRHLLLSEIDFLEQTLRSADLKLDVAGERGVFFKLCQPWLNLLHSCPDTPMFLLKQILQQSGWEERWQTETPAARATPLPRQAPKQAIAQYKLSESGRLLLASLEPQDLLSDTVQNELQNHIIQRTKAATPQRHSEYETHIREITQVIMQLAQRKYSSVEKVSTRLTEIFLTSLPVHHHTIRIIILFSLTQEQVLGTQNLKYRLNDATRGLAISLARHVHRMPEWESDLYWVWHALMDTILEVYESFSLADNALRSFSEAFAHEKQKLTHETWKKLEPKIKQILSYPRT
jgi:hypothetical protein